MNIILKKINDKMNIKKLKQIDEMIRISIK